MNTTLQLISMVRTYEEANEAVGGRRDIIDAIWMLKAELAQRPVRERIDAELAVRAGGCVK